RTWLGTGGAERSTGGSGRRAWLGNGGGGGGGGGGTAGRSVYRSNGRLRSSSRGSTAGRANDRSIVSTRGRSGGLGGSADCLAFWAASSAQRCTMLLLCNASWTA